MIANHSGKMVAMSLERWVVVVCIGSGIALLVRAIFVSGKRWRLLIPSVALLALGGYELWMNQWETTVSAAIRLDMMAEIPVVVIFLVWGALAVMFSRRKKDETAQAK